MKSNLLEGIIFDVHMHSITHTVEPQIDMPIVDLSHGNTLAIDPDTWQDVVALLHYMMLVFLFVANEAFHRFSMWEQVSIERRFPIPQIYDGTTYFFSPTYQLFVNGFAICSMFFSY